MFTWQVISLTDIHCIMCYYHWRSNWPYITISIFSSNNRPAHFKLNKQYFGMYGVMKLIRLKTDAKLQSDDPQKYRWAKLISVVCLLRVICYHKSKIINTCLQKWQRFLWLCHIPDSSLHKFTLKTGAFLHKMLSTVKQNRHQMSLSMSFHHFNLK